MASLTIENVGKKFGNIRALENVSIEVEDGEFLVLVGPSGCGKSTLLRMIAGLEDLSDGKVLLDDEDVSFVDPKDRDIAMVFQNYALYPHMTVYDNMAFSLQQRKVPKAKIPELINDAARILDLEPLLDRKPGALSGGQRQRVAMGRALVRNPALYLMDEPLSNLDAKLRVQMRAELKLLRERLGVTTVYVTHDQVEAMTLGDRVAVLAPWREDESTNLQRCDSPQKLYLEPRNMFVAGFIGSPAMNFFYVDLKKTDKGMQAQIVDTETIVQVDQEAVSTLDQYVNQRIVMGIRPEFFTINNDSHHNSTMDIKVMVSELVGPDAFLYFDLPTPKVGTELMQVLNDGEKAPASAARFTARVDTSALAGKNGPMTLDIDMSKVLFFHPDTGLRISRD